MQLTQSLKIDVVQTEDGEFGANETQRQIFGGATPGIDPVGRSEAVQMIRNNENGTLESPTFIPTVPQKE